MITSEPLVEAAVRQTRNRATRFILQFRFSQLWPLPDREEEFRKIKNKTFQPRNEAALNFVSLRSLLHYGGVGTLSRVGMNALRAPLTASRLPIGEVCLLFLLFLLDKADDFIDGSRYTRSWRALFTSSWQTRSRLRKCQGARPM